MTELETLAKQTAPDSPQQPPSRDALLQSAEALIPLLREQQAEADMRGHYSEEAHRAMLAGGLYRIVQPRMFGGLEMSWCTLLEVTARIARGHPSSGWCYCLSTSHALLLASHWPEQAQRELFGSDGDFRAPHRAVPAGVFTPVEGGYRVSGVWSYSSGIPYATHFFGGGMIPRAGATAGGNFIVARSEVEVLPDWGGDAVLGMQGSGSNSVKLDEVFVPDRQVAFADALFGQDLDWAQGTPGTRLHGNPMYLGVAGGAYHLCFSAIMSGAARAALDEYEELIRGRKAYGSRNPMVQDPDIHRHLGDILTLVECAEAILRGAAEIYEGYLERWGRTGAPITTEDTMRVWAMGRQSSFMSCAAVEQMFHSGGVASANRGQRLQRYFRDVQMFRIHPSSQSWVPEARGQTHVGLPPAKFQLRR